MLEPGTQLGRYEIQRRLGRGGMGTVYVAHDPVLGRMVAIKVFAGELEFPDARERFSREARSAAALNHPNIVTVYDFGELESQPFIVMEYVPGETLAAIIRRKADVPTADKLRWIDELCAGAGYAHQKSVIHRDIKPANLMIERSGRLKILDFGIARVMGLASNTTAMIGTPGYMAPEQIEGTAADHRADLFSIGVVSYELLSYTEAFPGDTIPAITHRILSEDPVPLTHLVDGIDPAVASVIERALQKNAADRFEDAESMRAAIGRLRRQYEADVTSIRPAEPPRRDTPSGPSRGTGSAKRPASGAVGVASLTPPPDRRGTDREALARLRASYLEAALESARNLFNQGQLEAALSACHQALTYDETHAGALDLEEQIKGALLVDGGVEGGDAPASFPEDPLGLPSDVVTDVEPAGASATEPTAADRTVLRVPFARTPPPVSEPTLLRPSAARLTPSTKPPVSPPLMPPSEATIVAPSRRTPPPAPVPAPQAKAPQPELKGPAPRSKPPKPESKAPTPAPRVADILARLRALVPPLPSIALPSIDRKQVATRNAAIWGGAALLVVVLAAGLLMLGGGTASSGTLILDAVPWATVSAVVSSDGEPQELPSPASTPLALTLPAGDYEVVLVGPPPESQEQRVAVHVDADGAAVVPAVRFRAVTPEEYFEQYLASPVGTAPAPEPGAPSAPPDAAPITGVTP